METEDMLDPFQRTINWALLETERRSNSVPGISSMYLVVAAGVIFILVFLIIILVSLNSDEEDEEDEEGLNTLELMKNEEYTYVGEEGEEYSGEGEYEIIEEEIVDIGNGYNGGGGDYAGNEGYANNEGGDGYADGEEYHDEVYINPDN